MEKQVYRGYLDKSIQLKIYDHPHVVNELMKFEGQEISITIEKANKQRSPKQNRYFWLLVTIIQREWLNQTGEYFSNEEIHNYILQNIAKPKFTTKEVMGTTIIMYAEKSTSKMSKQEFNHLKEQMQGHFKAKFDIELPDPQGECFWNDFV